VIYSRPRISCKGEFLKRREHPFPSLHFLNKRGWFMSHQTILIVEDSDDIRLLMKAVLELKGYRVIEAADGQQALKLALETPPQLILMDLSMPVLDGWEATRQLRQLEHLREVPIVGLSAHCYGERRDLAIRVGCNDCLPKPVDEQMLDRILSRFVRQTQ
jgi:two-component system, cell cycle response regulator DivK